LNNGKAEEHLGTNEELTEFSIEMATQLNYHRDEKQSMRKWSFEQVMKNNIPEIQERINLISRNYQTILDGHIGGVKIPPENIVLYKKEIIKQFVHIGNYAMMGWLKTTEHSNGLGDKL